MQYIVERKGYRLLQFVAVAGLLALALIVGLMNVGATHNDGQLELDGNAVFDAGGRGPNAGDSPCDGQLPTPPGFVTPPAPPDCIQTGSPAAYDWAEGAGVSGVCTQDSANLIEVDTTPLRGDSRVCNRDFVVPSV